MAAPLFIPSIETRNAMKVKGHLRLTTRLKSDIDNNALDYCQDNCIDSIGLPTTVLTIPLTGDDQPLPPPSISSISGVYAAPVISPRSASEDYEEYDKIYDVDFYNSSARRSKVLEDPANHSPLCRVLYDFEPKHEDEIKVRAGECVVVKDRIGDDWLIGHVFTDDGNDCKTGRFPTSYVAF
ncbi:SH3 domain protein [Dictyocaulus viviparus]|uniref:SH3 domain protein n=1 Tax=Dictyocaulus viviparus TaxID=29172 RepID=A0A0D8XKT3_DICVI|nr:SH3 domain protein [Dictyocaulus viviparus]